MDITNSLVVVGNWCNLRCPHCLQGADFSREKEVPINDIIKFLDGFPRMNHLKITGGEPLGGPNYERTYKLAKHAVDKGWTVRINTNGTCDISDFDLNPKLVDFQVSLDGLKGAHEGIRGKGTFDKAIEFIKTQKDKGYEVNVMSVIMGQFTKESLDDFADFVTITLNTPLTFQIVSPVGRMASKDVDLTIDWDYATKRLMDDRTSNANVASCIVEPEVKHCPHAESDRVAIDELGNIIRCPMLGEYKFGTIYNYNEAMVRKIMDYKIKNITCHHPEGYDG